jgi:1-aminocyclopropane-1-carboxylate deaminase/D-cysteine desulfhydrase-like pyridoxal-dependent ACC family enzyme
LNDFLDQWDHEACPIEPVYSGKAVWGLNNLIEQQKINSKHIIYLHTGGLQGARKA